MNPVFKTIIVIFVILFIIGIVGVIIFVAEFANTFNTMQPEKGSTFSSDTTATPSTSDVPTTEATIPVTEIEDTDSAEPTLPVITNRFVGTIGCEFTVNEPFELDGIIYTISRIKICSEKDSETTSYNYYKIFYEYTIQNNRKETIEWDMAYNGNIYGLLCYKGAERILGGNSFISDEGFDKAKYAPEGTLSAGETVSGYNSVICLPDPLNYPEEIWPLYTSEPFSLILHLLVNNTDYSLTISFNQNA